MAILLKLKRIPIIVVARGSEYYYMKKLLPLRDRIAFRLTYYLADLIIYKELYMKDLLLQFRAKNYRMLPNAVDIPVHINSHYKEKCYFLYLNSIKEFRYPEIPLKAFLSICRDLCLTRNSNIRLLIVGLRDEKVLAIEREKEKYIKHLLFNKDLPVELHKWTDEPEEYLNVADVFLLPADIVFLNYTLLEAMARGIPAIVQETKGSELIITHGVDGYILSSDPNEWKKYMLKLIYDVELRRQLGMAARQKVIKKYSTNTYAYKYDKIYKEVLKLKEME